MPLDSVFYMYTHSVIYSVTGTLQSLGIRPICLPTSSVHIGLDTGPIPSLPVGIDTSSPKYPILFTGLITAAVPIQRRYVAAKFSEQGTDRTGRRHHLLRIARPVAQTVRLLLPPPL
jgi:hypothetical protein